MLSEIGHSGKVYSFFCKIFTPAVSLYLSLKKLTGMKIKFQSKLEGSECI